MISILYTIGNLKTAGMRNVIADLVFHLDRRYFLPMIAVQTISGSNLERKLQTLCKIFEIPLYISIWPFYRFQKSIYSTVQKIRNIVDLVHSFDYSSGWMEGLVVKLAGLPWIVEKTNFNWGSYRWFIKATLASKIVCLSHKQRNELFRDTIFYNKTTVIPTGVDLKKFSAVSVTDKVNKRKQLGVPLDAFVISCVADLVPVKGHKELLEAFAVVKKKCSKKILLLLVGGGSPEFESYLRKLADNLGILNWVSFLGRREDVSEILQISDGFVLATRNWRRKEAFGAAIVEAMGCGLPVIATRSGGPEEIVVDKETGWLVEADGFEPLIKPLLEMINDEEKSRNFGKAARKRAEEFFSVEKMVKQYQDLYLSILKKS